MDTALGGAESSGGDYSLRKHNAGIDLSVNDNSEREVQPTAPVATTTASTAGECVLTSLPAFADATAIALQARLLAIQSSLAAAVVDAAAHDERLAALTQHAVVVRLELAQGQGMLAARRAERAAEAHLSAIAKRSAGRAQQDAAAADARRAAAASAMLACRSAAAASRSALAACQTASASNAAGALQSAHAVTEVAAAESVVGAWARDDAAAVSAQERSLARLSGEASKRRLDFVNAVKNARAATTARERLAADYRMLHEERKALLLQWQASLRAVSERDADIAAGNAALATARGAHKERVAHLKEREVALEREHRARDDADSGAERASAIVAAARGTLADSVAKVAALRSDVDSLQLDVLAAADEAARCRDENTAAVLADQAARVELDRAQARLAEQRQRAATTVAAAGNAAAAATAQEGALAEVAARLLTAARDEVALRGAVSAARAALDALKPLAATAKGELASVEQRGRGLRGRLLELEASLGASDQHVYAAEFAVSAARARLSRLQGHDVPPSEQASLAKCLIDVQAELEAAFATERALVGALRTVRSETQAAARRRAAVDAAVTEANGTLTELTLGVRVTEDALRIADNNRVTSLVAHDSLKLDVRHARAALRAVAERGFAAKSRIGVAAAAVATAKRDGDASALILRSQARLHEAERHRLTIELSSRKKQALHLEARYVALIGKYCSGDAAQLLADGPAGDGAAIPARAAAGVAARGAARAAAVRQCDALIEESHGLSAAADAAESEATALRGALAHMDARNQSLRRGLSRAVPGSPAAATVRGLESELRATTAAWYKAKAAAARAATAAAAARSEESTAQCLADEAEVAATTAQAAATEETAAAAAAAAAHADDLAAFRVNLAAHRLRHTGDAEVPTPEEAHYAAMGTQDASATALHMLGQLAAGAIAADAIGGDTYTADDLVAFAADVTGELAVRKLTVPRRAPTLRHPRAAHAASGTASVDGDSRCGTPRSATNVSVTRGASRDSTADSDAGRSTTSRTVVDEGLARRPSSTPSMRAHESLAARTAPPGGTTSTAETEARAGLFIACSSTTRAQMLRAAVDSSTLGSGGAVGASTPQKVAADITAGSARSRSRRLLQRGPTSCATAPPSPPHVQLTVAGLGMRR